MMNSCVTMKDFSACLDMQIIKSSSLKYLSEDLSCQFYPQSALCLISALHPDLFSEDVENQQLHQHQDLILVEEDGKCPW